MKLRAAFTSMLLAISAAASAQSGDGVLHSRDDTQNVPGMFNFLTADGRRISLPAFVPVDPTTGLIVSGGGGGGGGGAVTVANGADAAEGNTAAAAYTDTSGAAAGTVVGIGKGQFVALSSILAKLNGTLTVNNAQVGGVAIATGTGTANAGTQRVAVSSDSFPTGGATATNQTGAGTAAQTIQGATASGVADAGNPVKVGCVYNSTLPTLTTGQRGDAQCDTRSGVLVGIKGANGTNLAAVSAPSNGASNTFGLVTTSQNTWATASGTWDYAYDLTGATAGAGVGVGAFGMVPTSAVTQGLQPATVASATSQVVKATAGNLYSINVDNAAVTGTYVIDYNATTAPTAGATLTASLILWHALLGSGQTLDKAFPVPVYATNGHVLLYSTSLTTFTAPATAPTLSTATFK